MRHTDKQTPVCSSLPFIADGSLCFAPSFRDRHFWLRSWSGANLGHITGLSWSGLCQLLQAHLSPFLACPSPSNNCKHHVASPYLPLLLPLSPSLGNPFSILITHLMPMCPLSAHFSAAFDTDLGAHLEHFFAWFLGHPIPTVPSNQPLSLLFSSLCQIHLLSPISKCWNCSDPWAGSVLSSNVVLRVQASGPDCLGFGVY